MGTAHRYREQRKMTRSQLITKVAGDTGMTASEVEKVMDSIFGTIGDVLKAVSYTHLTLPTILLV